MIDWLKDCYLTVNSILVIFITKSLQTKNQISK
jgi:hypothetical protein